VTVIRETDPLYGSESRTWCLRCCKQLKSQREIIFVGGFLNVPIEMQICHKVVSSSSLIHPPCPEMELNIYTRNHMYIYVSIPKDSLYFRTEWYARINITNECYSPLHCTTVWPGEPSRKMAWPDFMEWLRFNAPQNPAIHHTPS